jgi:phosphatidylglycerol:prolipoprotein diacylglycerol transferase
MHPVLIKLGAIRIYSYGFMLALSFLVGIVLASRRARRRGLDPDMIYDLSIVLVLAAVIGSRGLYILTHRDHFHGLLDIVALWQGGATYYGGLVLAVAGAAVFLRRRKIPFLRVADVCAPSIAAGVFLTRIGCFLSGCCFGNPTTCSLGVEFPVRSPAGWTFPGAAIHPTQLYASFYGLLILAILLVLDRRMRFDGFLFAWLCILYGVARFTIDFFRYYEDSAMVGGVLTINQVLSVGLVLFGTVWLVAGAIRSRAGGQAR